MPGFEPGVAGWEARMLLLCYAAPPCRRLDDVLREDRPVWAEVVCGVDLEVLGSIIVSHLRISATAVLVEVAK